jgi:hypothetical protein
MALASPGCTALNGTRIGGVLSGTVTAGGFSAGDIITVTVVNSVGGDTAGLGEYNPSFTARLANSSIVGSRTYTVPADTANNFTISGSYFNNASEFSWNCTAAARTNTDSQKLRSVQILGSNMVAQASGAAITGAVGNAINDAFASGGNPVTVGPNSMTFNFAADPEADVASSSDATRRADDAFAALAYAGGRYVKAARAAPTFERQWSLWADIRGTGWDRTNSSAMDLRGTQVNATAGIGYKLRPDVLVGAFAGYENFNYDFVSLAGNLKGSGGTVGGYAAWRITPTLRWDAMAGWSGLSYDGVAGTANGSFTGSRWIASTGLTGSYRVAAYIFEPSAKVYALWERQDAWIDSLGVSQSSRDFSTGRISTGGRVIAPWQTSATTTLSPYLGFYGDWRFATDNALPVGVPFVGLNDGWSGRVTGGVNIATAGGGSLALGGEYGGIGANYGVWTANARANWPF